MKRDGKTIRTILTTVIVTVYVIVSVCLVLLLKIDFPYKKLLKTIAIIETRYVDDYDRESCEEMAIRVILNSLGDDYTSYYDKEEAREVMEIVDGGYVGLGIVIAPDYSTGDIRIITVYEDSPADRAGIKVGDTIKKIDGKRYTNDTFDALSEYLEYDENAKKPDQVVSVVLESDGKEYSVELKREKINLYKVKSQVIDGICYIKYSGFTETSFAEFSDIVKGLDSSVEGVVIDLRNNPGGEFSAAIDMCDIFLDEQTIMYTVNKKGKKTYYNAQKGSVDIPLAVLINGSSASASEVFAGAMKANKRAVIVGERTYGKGLTQTLIGLDGSDYDEGVIKITTLKNYTPDGNCINDGISPDIEVSESEISEDIINDSVFLTAVKSLKEDK